MTPARVASARATQIVPARQRADRTSISGGETRLERLYAAAQRVNFVQAALA
jgi:hypothetical protein